ncbi:MAG: hypothetical protein ACRYG8_02355 [Janthinobacterium lividum]
MSYDIQLVDPVSREVLTLDQPHHMRGGTYCMGGESRAHLNVTYNYAPHFYAAMGEKGIRTIYGMTGAASTEVLERAAAMMGADVDPDYWKPTEGNARRALHQLSALAQMRPDGVWDGD